MKQLIKIRYDIELRHAHDAARNSVCTRHVNVLTIQTLSVVGSDREQPR